ncbi:MAG: hypothetical protein WCY19_05165 [Candidatus Gastranaerophilaceae bacterium]
MKFSGIFGEIEQKINECKKLIVSVCPIKDKNDYYMAGSFGISAGLSLIDEFINLDSATPEEFEETKNLTIDFLRKEIVKIRLKKFVKPNNVTVADFSKRGKDD